MPTADMHAEASAAQLAGIREGGVERAACEAACIRQRVLRAQRVIGEVHHRLRGRKAGLSEKHLESLMQIILDRIAWPLLGEEHVSDAAKAHIYYSHVQGRPVPTSFQVIGRMLSAERQVLTDWFDQKEFKSARRSIRVAENNAHLDAMVSEVLKEVDVDGRAAVDPRPLFLWGGMPEMTIGSDPYSVDVMVSDRDILPTHAHIHKRSNGLLDTWYLKNGAHGSGIWTISRHGWRSLGRGEEIEIDPGDIIRIGRTVFRMIKLESPSFVASQPITAETGNERRVPSSSSGVPLVEHVKAARIHQDEMVRKILNELPEGLDLATPQGRASLMWALVEILCLQHEKLAYLSGHPYFNAALRDMEQQIRKDRAANLLSYDPYYGELPPEDFRIPRRLYEALYELRGEYWEVLLTMPSRHLFYGGTALESPRRIDREIYQRIIGLDPRNSFEWDVPEHACFAEEIANYVASIARGEVYEDEDFMYGANVDDATASMFNGRIYLAIKRKYVRRFWKRLDKLAHKFGDVPLGWKIARHPNRYECGDGAVLYFNARDSERIYALVQKLQSWRGYWFEDKAPLLAARLLKPDGRPMKGVSFGVTPPDGRHSFNGELSEIISDALHGVKLRQHLYREITYDDIVRMIAYALHKNDVSLEYPAFRNEELLRTFAFIASHSDQRSANQR